MTLTLLQNIPDELKKYNQFVAWKYEERTTEDGQTKATKVPYSAVTGRKASPHETSMHAPWASFEYVYGVLRDHPEWYSGMGFVLSEDDPFCFIDLDDTKGDERIQKAQIKIFNEMGTYSEVSPSGKGCHLILKGSVPNGRKRHHIEIYSSQRFMTMTGNCVQGERLPVREDKQPLISILYGEMSDVGKSLTDFDFSKDYPPKYTDEQIYIFCTTSTNNALFNDLWAGHWQGRYPSQSEADLALCNILVLFTHSVEQLSRMFLLSGLGKTIERKQNPNDYLFNRLMVKAFDKKLPPANFNELKLHVGDTVKAIQKEEELRLASIPFVPQIKILTNQQLVLSGVIEDSPDLKEYVAQTPKYDFTLPPGRAGQLVEFFYRRSPIPLFEACITAALAWGAGVMGRHLNINGTGLNQYFVNVAPSGTGKDGPVQAMSALNSAIKGVFPSGAMFTGPSDFTSASSIYRTLTTKPCFCSTLGEISDWLEPLLCKRPNPNHAAVKRVLLTLYTQSGRGALFEGTAFSTKEKSIEPIKSPCLSFIGDTVADGFYKHISDSNIISGMFPRFTIVESYSTRAAFNGEAFIVMPPPDLVQYLAQVTAESHSKNVHNMILDIRSDPDAQRLLDDFEKYCSQQVNNTQDEGLRQLWNRTHLRALKTCGVVAGLDNYTHPIITLQIADWGVRFILNTTENLITRAKNFSLGNAYLSEDAQYIAFMQAINIWLKSRWVDLISYQKGTCEMHRDRVIPHAFLMTKLYKLKCFSEDRSGPNYALKRCVEVGMQNGDIQRVFPEDLMKYHFKGLAYRYAKVRTT